MTNRVFTPNNGTKSVKTGSFSSKDFQNLIQQTTVSANNTGSAPPHNNFLRSYFKTASRRSQDISPTKQPVNISELNAGKDTTDNQGKNQNRQGTYSDSLYLTSFIFRHRKLFSSYLGIISRLILRAPKTDVFTLLNEIYASNENWLEVLKLYVGGVFYEIAGLIERSDEEYAQTPAEFDIEKDKIALFAEARQILEYYNAVLYMCSWIIFKEKLNTATKDPSKKRWKNVIRKIFQNLMYLIKPNIGIFSEYLVSNSSMNSLIISHQLGPLNNLNLLRIRLYKSVLEFTTKVFSFNARFSCFLTEEIAGSYIRLAYINFVKLYSHSNNSELNEINLKINEISNKIRRNNNSGNINQDVENLTKLMRESSQPKGPMNNNNINLNSSFSPAGKNEEHPDAPRVHSRKNTETRSHQIVLSNQYVKLLFAIARNRTDEIKRKFYQYRILEFFSREIDLEFDINQIRERFLRIRNEAKRRFSSGDQDGVNIFAAASDFTPYTKPPQDYSSHKKEEMPSPITMYYDASQQSPLTAESHIVGKSKPSQKNHGGGNTGSSSAITRPKLDLSKLNLGGNKSQNNTSSGNIMVKDYKNVPDKQSSKTSNSIGPFHTKEDFKLNEDMGSMLKTDLKTENLPGDTEGSVPMMYGNNYHTNGTNDNSFIVHQEDSINYSKHKPSDMDTLVRDEEEPLDTEEHDTELSRRIQLMHQMQQAKKRPPIPSLNLAGAGPSSYYGGGLGAPVQDNTNTPSTKPVMNISLPSGGNSVNSINNAGSVVQQAKLSASSHTEYHLDQPSKKSVTSGRRPNDLQRPPSAQLKPKEDRQEPIHKPDLTEENRMTEEKGNDDTLSDGSSGIISLRQQKPNPMQNRMASLE